MSRGKIDESHHGIFPDSPDFRLSSCNLVTDHAPIGTHDLSECFVRLVVRGWRDPCCVPTVSSSCSGTPMTRLTPVHWVKSGLRCLCGRMPSERMTPVKCMH